MIKLHKFHSDQLRIPVAYYNSKTIVHTHTYTWHSSWLAYLLTYLRLTYLLA